MEAGLWPKHSVRTPEYKEVFSERRDFAYDTPAQQPAQVFSLTGDTNLQDVDGDHDEDDQDIVPMSDEHENDYAHQIPSTMVSKFMDDEKLLADGGRADANPDTQSPFAETKTLATNASTSPERKQKVFLSLKMPKRTPNPPSDSFTTQAPATTKLSRRSKARKIKDDTLTGSELEAYWSGLGGNGGGRGNEEYMPSSPPVMLPPKRGVGRPHKQEYVPSTPTEQVSSSSTLEEEQDDLTAALYQGLTSTNNDSANPPTNPFYACIPREVHDAVAELAALDPVEVNLRPLHTATGTWTAEQLTYFYISAYQSQYWHICDLIADTWIRAFQNLNKTNPIWRANKSGYLYKAKNTDVFGLQKFDPPLESKVCAFEARLLNNLYHHTDKECGARMLWADSMALVGAEWEAELTSRKRRHNEWHPDLTYNVMCTALRMVRRKLTLKIEESTEGVWCKRYHMHTLHGQPCYRELAADTEMATGGGRKRVGEELQGSPQKRVAFGGVVDDDNSEEE